MREGAMAYTVVCFSHVTAAGGETIAKRVAESLGFRLADYEVVVPAAARAGVDPNALASIEHFKGFFTRIMDALVGPARGAPELSAVPRAPRILFHRGD